MLHRVTSKFPACEHERHEQCHVAYKLDPTTVSICNCSCHVHGLKLEHFAVWNNFWIVDYSGAAPLVMLRRGGIGIAPKRAMMYFSLNCCRGHHMSCVEIAEGDDAQYLCSCDCHFRNRFGFAGGLGYHEKVKRALAEYLLNPSVPVIRRSL
jgi:hypothetical protein